MDKNISVRLINKNNIYDSKWYITVNADIPFSVIVTRFPKETKENLLKELYSLPDLERTTIFSQLDQKHRIYI